ncbi:MAG: SusC/RagA family TonB-linked outer membrane protein [Mucilaginibacter sp.]|nr:SusC/RagA family TonB-linked outer membrane protein [Mucilaginibacter sp.]
MRKILFKRPGHLARLQWLPCKAHSKKAAFIFSIIFCFLISVSAFAQTRHQVSGTVVGADGESLIGVTVKVKGTQIGISTDVNGKFSINAPNANGTLVVSYLSYETKEVPINGQSVLKVQLKPNNASLQEVVVTGYGSQKKESLTGAISSTTSKELDRVHAASTVSSALAGKIAGLTFKQSEGRPGASATIQIRNMGSPLFVIDGIQTDEGQFNNIAPNDVESISILKDGSAAIYGMRAANGVVVVTTKKGKGEGSINVDSYLGFQNFYRFPKAQTSSYQYMYYKAEANVNDAGTTPITQSELDKYKAGTDPGYKSYNWQKFIIDDNGNAPQNFFNMNFQGSSDKVNYYVSGSHIYQASNLGKEFNFQRTNIQSNINVKLSTGLSVRMEINGRVEDRENPGVPGGDDYDDERYALQRNTPLERPYANDNPNYLGDIVHNNTNYAFLNNKLSGHQSDVWRILNTKIAADYQIPGVKGLTLSGTYDYYYADRLLNNFEYTFKAYTYRPATDTYEVTGGSTNPYRQRIQAKVFNTTGQAILNYANSFGKSTIGATLVAERLTIKNISATVHSIPVSNNLPLIYFPTSDSYDDVQTEQARLGYVARLNYNYANKYYAEFAGRKDETYLFAPGKRTGYFPGGSIGWRITEEGPIKKLLGDKSFLNNLKFRASYGVLGDDRNPDGTSIVPTYAYLPGYNYNLNGVAILDGNAVTVARDKGVPIDNVSWTKSKITDIGADFSLFNNKLNGTIDYFYRKRTGLLGSLNNILLPSELGYALPQQNLNSDAQFGEELSLDYTNKIGKVGFNIGGNISYSRSETLQSYNPVFFNSLDQYRNSTVNRYSRIDWGYIVSGQFTSQDQINNYPVNIDGKANKTLLPGDLIYKDLNNDGKIDANDQRPIGYGNGQPNINFGLSLGATYKGFDFHADFSGGSGFTWFQTNESQVPFTNNGNLNTIFEDRWHHANLYDVNSAWIPGYYPANRFNNTGLSDYSGNSTFWGHNVFYLRARTLELGYSLPVSLLSKMKIKKARFYVNAYNMLSFDNLKKFGVDPESTQSNGQQVPQSKVTNIGVNLTF